jgi:hypothetical protein
MKDKKHKSIFYDTQQNMEILAEESAEIISILSEIIKTKSKIIRFGNEAINPITLKAHFEELNNEIGDLFAMIDILIEQDVLDEEKITSAKLKKFMKLEQWYIKK